MTAQTEDRQPADGRTGVYVYGILPGDVEVQPGTAGIGDPPGEVRAVRYRDLTALVSDVDQDRPLGRAEDLFTHEELLDSSAADVPVLPLRFGAVLASDDAVTGELLGPHYDEFAAALQQLEGHAEYVVKGRYVEQAMLGEILAKNPEAARLGKQVSEADPDVTRSERIQLGEIVAAAVEASREADTRALGDAVDGHVAASVVRPPTHELDAVHAAFLVEMSTAEALRQAVQQLADQWQDRVDLRLIGPLAAYDFVGAAAPTASSPARNRGEATWDCSSSRSCRSEESSSSGSCSSERSNGSCMTPPGSGASLTRRRRRYDAGEISAEEFTQIQDELAGALVTEAAPPSVPGTRNDRS